MPPMKMANVVSSGRYMPTENSIGLFTCTRISAKPMQNADHHQRPRHVAAHDALRQRRHQAGLRRRKLAVAEADAAALMLPWCSTHQREVQARGSPPTMPMKSPICIVARRAAQDVPDLQVLQHLAGHGRGYADHRRHAQHGGHAGHVPSRPMATISSAAMISVRQRQARDRVVRRADHAHQVARNRREEESEHDHHDRRHHRRPQSCPAK